MGATMAKRSVFHDFIAVLRTDWQTTFTWVRPLEASFAPLMPKASTFYAGLARRADTHVFLNFQHSSKAWQVGQFTINVIISRRMGPPLAWATRFASDLESLDEGSYRIGHVNGGRDKWWRLKNDDLPSFFGPEDGMPTVVFEGWRPGSYADSEAVLVEAVADVNRDVASALGKIGVTEGVGRADA